MPALVWRQNIREHELVSTEGKGLNGVEFKEKTDHGEDDARANGHGEARS